VSFEKQRFRRPFPGHEEPKRNKVDLAVFDRCNVTKPIRLFDGELKPTVEERPERKPYTLERRKRPLRRFLNHATGEVVLRTRGGKGFTRIYERLDPNGLLRVRGRLMPVMHAEVTGALTVQWVEYPRAWNAVEPDEGPYVLRAVAELALSGADVSGHSDPAVRDYLDQTLRANKRPQDDVQSIGPRINESPDGERLAPFVSFTGEIIWCALPAGAPLGPARYRIELEERKRLGRERAWVPGMPMRVDEGRRAKTSEQRNESTGEMVPRPR
jgi:hypothetical protein